MRLDRASRIVTLQATDCLRSRQRSASCHRERQGRTPGKLEALSCKGVGRARSLNGSAPGRRGATVLRVTVARSASKLCTGHPSSVRLRWALRPDRPLAPHGPGEADAVPCDGGLELGARAVLEGELALTIRATMASMASRRVSMASISSSGIIVSRATSAHGQTSRARFVMMSWAKAQRRPRDEPGPVLPGGGMTPTRP